MATSQEPITFREMKAEENDINVLFLGETGLGKSTLINSIVNYLQYESFDDAVESGVKHVIPTTIHFNENDSSGNFIRKKVSLGNDSNEDGSVTSSATQSCRSYVIPSNRVTKSRLRIIDTPGIGDTRGIFQDKANLEDIFSYIGKISKLHAICLLLRPNESRLTATFVYCVNQLLARLEKSASENIVFVFTNARNSRFKPGNTITALNELIESIAKGPSKVVIPLSSENTFYFDNEAFRYLVALKGDIKLSDKPGYLKSWDKSWSESERLIKYVVGEGPRKMAPHEVMRTLSVNQARCAILELAKPLADITEHIDDNLHVLGRHEKQVNVDTASLNDLKVRLYVPVVNLEMIECTQPKTVCGSDKCCKKIKIGERESNHYAQRCHDPCYLTNIQKELIGDQGLTNCAAMDRSGMCTLCKCSFQTHLHIYYETRPKQDRIEDSGVQAQIKDRKSAIKAHQENIKKVNSRKKEFEDEKKQIIRAMARFAHFLEEYAISPFNDSYKNYIKIAIKREEDRGPECNQTVLESLQDLLRQYEEERNLLEEARKMKRGVTDLGNVTAESIMDEIKKLYSLKHTGAKIRNLHEKQSRGERSEQRNTEMFVPEEGLKPHSSGKKANQTNANKQQNKQKRSNQNRNQNQNWNHNQNWNQNRNPGNYQNRNGENHQNRNPGNYQNRNGENHQNRNPGNYQNSNRGNHQNRNPGNNWNRQPRGNPNQNRGYPNNDFPNQQFHNNPHQIPPLMPPPYNSIYPNSNPYYPPNQNIPQFHEQQPYFPQQLYQPNVANPYPQNNHQIPPNNQSQQRGGNSIDSAFVRNDTNGNASNAYDELYGNRNSSEPAGSSRRNELYANDSDSDNEGAEDFDKFKEKYAIDDGNSYSELYGDSQGMGRGIIKSFRNMFK